MCCTEKKKKKNVTVNGVSYHFVIVGKSYTGPRARVRRGDREPHVIGFRRVRPDDVILALARGHVASFRCRPLTVTVAGRRHGRLMLDRRSVIVVRLGIGFRRLLLGVVRRLLSGFV